MKIELERYLEDLEERLNPDDEQRLRSEWLDWTEFKNPEGLFCPRARKAVPSRLDWPHVNINDAIEDDDLSIYREMEGVNNALVKGNNAILRVRANYGVGNLASSLGAELFIMPKKADTLPNVRFMGEEKARRLLEEPMPDINAGNFRKIWRIAERYRKIAEQYPKLGEYLRFEQPDLQGPVDNLELIWGSDMFYAMYDDPDTVHALLDKITTRMEQMLDHWLEFFPNPFGVASYFRHVEKGAIALRDDSAMNLSPEFFTEFIAPYDGRLLAKYGGLVHFCGRGEHFIELLTNLKGIHGVNMSQPHLNDMEKIFAATIDRGIHLSLSTGAIETGRHDVHNLVFLEEVYS